MSFFRKKPVVIEAIQWKGDNESFSTIVALSRPNGQVQRRIVDNGAIDLMIYTLEGVMRANIGDWIIKGVQGELYACKSDIFDMTYEKVE